MKITREVFSSGEPPPLPTTIYQPPLTPCLALRVPSSTVPFLNFLLNGRHDLNPMLLSLLARVPGIVSHRAEFNLFDAAVGEPAIAAWPAPTVVLVWCAAHSRFQRSGLTAGAVTECIEGKWRGMFWFVWTRRAAGRDARGGGGLVDAVFDVARRSRAPAAVNVAVPVLGAAQVITAAKRSREVSRDHCFQRRDAGAQDPRVHFQTRPEGCEGVVVGDVGRLQED